MMRLAAVLAVIIIGTALFWRSAERWAPPALGGSSQPESDYVTQPAAVGEIRRTISATGSLKARSTVDVSSQLSGQIVSVAVDFNDRVTKDQVLAELDRRGFQARVSQAEAEAVMAREAIAVLSARRDHAQRLFDEQLTQRRVFAARIDKARAAAAAAGRQRARSETLQRQGATTLSAADDARTAVETAEAALREAEALAAAHEHAVGSLEAKLREVEAELANARAALPLRDAALELARLDLERSAIRSPIDGVVVSRAIEPGQTVAVSLDARVLFSIAGDLSKMEIHAQVDEADIGEISAGQRATFNVNAFPGRAFPAGVSKIRKLGQLVQGVVTYTVVLEADNHEGRLLPGMTSTVRIVVEEVGPTLIVPLAALRFAPNGSSPTGQGVWVLRHDRTIEPRTLLLGPDDRRNVAVLKGNLAEGEAVILARSPSAESGRLFGIRF